MLVSSCTVPTIQRNTCHAGSVQAELCPYREAFWLPWSTGASNSAKPSQWKLPRIVPDPDRWKAQPTTLCVGSLSAFSQFLNKS